MTDEYNNKTNEHEQENEHDIHNENDSECQVQTVSRDIGNVVVGSLAKKVSKGEWKDMERPLSKYETNALKVMAEYLDQITLSSHGKIVNINTTEKSVMGEYYGYVHNWLVTNDIIKAQQIINKNNIVDTKKGKKKQNQTNNADKIRHTNTQKRITELFNDITSNFDMESTTSFPYGAFNSDIVEFVGVGFILLMTHKIKHKNEHNVAETLGIMVSTQRFIEQCANLCGNDITNQTRKINISPVLCSDLVLKYNEMEQVFPFDGMYLCNNVPHLLYVSPFDKYLPVNVIELRQHQKDIVTCVKNNMDSGFFCTYRAMIGSGKTTATYILAKYVQLLRGTSRYNRMQLLFACNLISVRNQVAQICFNSGIPFGIARIEGSNMNGFRIVNNFNCKLDNNRIVIIASPEIASSILFAERLEWISKKYNVVNNFTSKSDLERIVVITKKWSQTNENKKLKKLTERSYDWFDKKGYNKFNKNNYNKFIVISHPDVATKEIDEYMTDCHDSMTLTECTNWLREKYFVVVNTTKTYENSCRDILIVMSKNWVLNDEKKKLKKLKERSLEYLEKKGLKKMNDVNCKLEFKKILILVDNDIPDNLLELENCQNDFIVFHDEPTIGADQNNATLENNVRLVIRNPKRYILSSATVPNATTMKEILPNVSVPIFDIVSTDVQISCDMKNFNGDTFAPFCSCKTVDELKNVIVTIKNTPFLGRSLTSNIAMLLWNSMKKHKIEKIPNISKKFKSVSNMNANSVRDTIIEMLEVLSEQSDEVICKVCEQFKQKDSNNKFLKFGTYDAWRYQNMTLIATTDPPALVKECFGDLLNDLSDNDVSSASKIISQYTKLLERYKLEVKEIVSSLKYDCSSKKSMKDEKACLEDEMESSAPLIRFPEWAQIGTPKHCAKYAGSNKSQPYRSALLFEPMIDTLSELNCPEEFILLLMCGVGIYQPINNDVFGDDYFDLVLEMASTGKLAYLVADGSISYGTNYPFNRVIIMEDFSRSHSVNTIYQLMGRAGRVGKSWRAEVIIDKKCVDEMANSIASKKCDVELTNIKSMITMVKYDKTRSLPLKQKQDITQEHDVLLPDNEHNKSESLRNMIVLRSNKTIGAYTSYLKKEQTQPENIQPQTEPDKQLHKEPNKSKQREPDKQQHKEPDKSKQREPEQSKHKEPEQSQQKEANKLQHNAQSQGRSFTKSSFATNQQKERIFSRNSTSISTDNATKSDESTDSQQKTGKFVPRCQLSAKYDNSVPSTRNSYDPSNKFGSRV